MWCVRKGIECPYSGAFGECHRSACGLPNAELSTFGTLSYIVNTMTEKSIDDIKREAVKEFAEKLKKKYGKSCSEYYPMLIEMTSYDIDQLLKEYEK